MTADHMTGIEQFAEAKSIQELFALREIRGKRVFIVDDHQKAFAAWAVVRRELQDPPILITFDHHTDTMDACGNLSARTHPTDDEARKAYRLELQSKLGWTTDDEALWSIARLRNDEHIEAAAICGMLRASFSIQLDHPGDWPGSVEEAEHDARLRQAVARGEPPPPKPRRPFSYRKPPHNVFIVGHECFFECEATRHNDECIQRHYSQIIESVYVEEQLARAADMARCIGIEGGVEAVPYILDIDLDVFHTVAATEPNDAASFHRLVRGAVAITIATEPEFVAGYWWTGEKTKLTADQVLERVLAHVDRAMQ